MGIQTTYHCDNNGCRNTSTSLDGWFGLNPRDNGLRVRAYGPNDQDGELELELACSEGCALAMIGRRLQRKEYARGRYPRFKMKPVHPADQPQPTPKETEIEE